MTPPLGSLIFWMISIGLVIGFVSRYIYGERGVKLLPSLAVATAGSLITGLIAFFVVLQVPMAYAAIGAIASLFLVNSFRQKKKGAFMDVGES